MNQKIIYIIALLFCVTTMFFTPGNVYACAVCFGATDLSSRMGLAMAILTLLCILLFVLSGFIAFFVQIQKRAKKFLLLNQH